MNRDIDAVIIEEAQKAIVRRLTPEKIAEVKELHSEKVREFTTELDKVDAALENKPSGALVDSSIIAVKEFKEQINRPQALGEIAIVVGAFNEDFLSSSLVDVIVNNGLGDIFTDFDSIDRCASLGIRAEEIAHLEMLVVEDVEEYLESKK